MTFCLLRLPPSTKERGESGHYYWTPVSHLGKLSVQSFLSTGPEAHHDSGHAGDAPASDEWRNHGRRGHDLAVICRVAAAYAAAAIPVPVDVSDNVTSQQDQIIETVGAAIADTFERRWQAADDSPLIPMSPRDPLRGLIGGLLPFAQDATQVRQVEPHDLYADSVPYGLVPPRPVSTDIMSGYAR